MTTDKLTEQEILEAMGNLATEEEADAMRSILGERGITTSAELNAMGESEFFALIPLAIEQANEAGKHAR